jgi:hypothetical protein
MLSARVSGVRGESTTPVTPSIINSCGPPWSETITGRPEAWASSTTLPKVSVVLGKTKTSDEA